MNNFKKQKEENLLELHKINFSLTATYFHTCLWANNTHSKKLAITTPCHLWSMVIPGQSRLVLKRRRNTNVTGVLKWPQIKQAPGY